MNLRNLCCYFKKNEITNDEMHRKWSNWFKFINKWSKFMNVEQYSFLNWQKEFTFAPKNLEYCFWCFLRGY